ncbi:MAG: pyrroline-5-carboxylate reductase [Verrucomicrobiaceae bacterium]|nr:pyrroline-5-carboxylate reductase [Verrucomicrobiaceae bacterium]
MMTKIALLGCGKMGSALVNGIARSLGKGVAFWFYDVHPASAEALSSLGTVSDSAAAAVTNADVVILAVKPGDMRALCQSLASLGGDRLYLSIAAGLKLVDLQSWLGGNQRVIRVMPNTPALVGMGASAFSRGERATENDAALARQLLGAVGTADEVAEKLLDAVTGLSGSGPAYGYTIIEALADGGVLMGLPRATAVRLAAQTMLGAAEMVLKTGKHTGSLRDEVTSPGGTTAAGLEALELGGLRAALLQAVRSATERAIELGQK